MMDPKPGTSKDTRATSSAPPNSPASPEAKDNAAVIVRGEKRKKNETSNHLSLLMKSVKRMEEQREGLLLRHHNLDGLIPVMGVGTTTHTVNSRPYIDLGNDPNLLLVAKVLMKMPRINDHLVVMENVKLTPGFQPQITPFYINICMRYIGGLGEFKMVYSTLLPFILGDQFVQFKGYLAYLKKKITDFRRSKFRMQSEKDVLHFQDWKVQQLGELFLTSSDAILNQHLNLQNN